MTLSVAIEDGEKEEGEGEKEQFTRYTGRMAEKPGKRENDGKNDDNTGRGTKSGRRRRRREDVVEGLKLLRGIGKIFRQPRLV